MTAEIDAFLDAIHDNPNDALPRLVFADWLDEYGESEYAELIRLDHQLEEREPLRPDVRSTMRRRRHELRTLLSARWTASVTPDFRLNWSRHSIIAQGIYVTPEHLMKADRWPPYVRPRRVSLLRYLGSEVSVVTCRYFSHVRNLHLFPRSKETTVTKAEDWVMLAALMAYPNNLESLGMDDPALTAEQWMTFANSAFGSQLSAVEMDFSARIFPDRYDRYDRYDNYVTWDDLTPGDLPVRIAELLEQFPALPLPE